MPPNVNSPDLHPRAGAGLTAGVSQEIDGGSPVIVNGVLLASSGTAYAFSLCGPITDQTATAFPRMPGQGLGML
jgi:hypothetical protein